LAGSGIVATKTFALLSFARYVSAVHHIYMRPPIRLDAEGCSIFNKLLFRRGCPIFYPFDLLYLNGRDLRELPLTERKEKLRKLIGNNALPDVICGKYIEGRGVDLFNEVVLRNLEGVVAKRKTGTYATVSSWLKIKNLNYTQSERRHELYEIFGYILPR
jgi:ATP-dependent DNA ligase